MTSKETKRKPSEISKQQEVKDRLLILYNDDVHSFDYVTVALMEICQHSFEQASQCTLITHYKGKCDVKKGDFDSLKPLRDALLNKKLNATID